MSAPSEITLRSLAVIGGVLVASTISAVLITNVAITLFIGRIASDYGWSHAQVAVAASLIFVGMGVGAPLFGPLVDRRGPRFVMLPLVVIAGLLIGALGLIGRSLPLFYAIHFLIGISTPGAVAISKLVSNWFFKWRGIALTAMGGGAFLGSVVAPQVTHALLLRCGWQGAYLAFAAAELFIVFPVLFLTFRERPIAVHAGGAVSSEIQPDGAPPIGVLQALKGRTFWLVVSSQITGMFAQLGFGVNALGIITERGVNMATAVIGLSVLSVGGLVAQLATGVLLDRLDTPRVIVPFAILSALSLPALYLSHGNLLVILSLILFGLGVGGQTSMTSYFTTRFFGVRNFSAVYGATLPVLLLCSAPAPIVVSAIFDHTHAFGVALAILELSLIVSIGLFLSLEPYPYPVKAELDHRASGRVASATSRGLIDIAT